MGLKDEVVVANDPNEVIILTNTVEIYTVAVSYEHL